MASSRIKGITVEIGGNTTGLSKALSDVNKEISDTQKQLKDVNRLLKIDPGNTELLRQKYDLLNKSIESTEKKLESLKDAEKQVQAQFARGEIGEEQYNGLRREIIATESSLEKLSNEAASTRKAIDKIDESPVEDVEKAARDAGDSLEDAGKEASNFGDYLKAGAIIEGVKGIADGIKSLNEETKEYRKIMASLEVSSERAGYSAEETAESYRTLYSVLGDEQTAATTTANLQAIGLSQNDLKQIIDSTIGAWATYGDSIPIDGLSEAVNETIRVGKVTGTFADVLNWAGTNEDEFNARLEAANSETERATIVLQEMARQGLDEAGRAWRENNKDIVESNEATQDFQDSLAELSRRTAPLTNAVQDGINGILEKSLDLTKDVDFDDFAESIEDAFDFLIDEVVPAVFDFVEFILDNKGAVIGAITGIGTALVAMKAVETITKIVNVTKQAVTAIKAAKTAQDLWNLAMNSNVIGLVTTGIGILVGGVVALSQTTNEATEAERRQREEMEALRAKSDELAESYRTTKEAAAEKATADLAQITNVQSLWNEMQNLVSANGEVQEQDRARVEFILGQLNEALGTEYALNGNILEQYKEMSDSIDTLIQKKQLEILMQQAEENYANAIKNRAEAQDLFAESYRQMNDSEAELDELRARRSEILAEKQKMSAQGVLDRWHDLYDEELRMLNDNIGRQEDLFNEKEAIYNQNAAALQQYEQDITRYTTASELAIQGHTGAAITVLEKQNESFTNAADVVGKSAEEQKQVLGEQYAKSIVVLEDYAKKYVDGTEGYTNEGLEQLKSTAIKARDEAKSVGVNIVDGMVEGINGNKWRLENAIKSLSNGIPELARDVLGIHSPSRIMEEIGDETGAGLDIGLERSFSKSQNIVDRAFGALISLADQLAYDFANSLPQFESGLFSFHTDGMNAYESVANYAGATTNTYSSSTTNLGGVNISVYGAPGQNVNELADVIMDKIEFAVQRRGAVFG